MKPERETSEIAQSARISLTGRRGSYLLLDASLPRIQTGILQEGEWAAWEDSQAEAEETLFAGAESCLKKSGLAIDELSGFLFCEGPGSVLGIRIAAMAIRTWRMLAKPCPPPVYAYQNLQFLACSLLAEGKTPPFGVISDARRMHWNLQEVAPSGELLPLRRVPAEELKRRDYPGGLWKPAERYVSQAIEDRVKTIDYSLYSHSALLWRTPIFTEIEQPAPLLLQTPSYTKWVMSPHHASE